jgi:hypothetical protein
MSRDRRTNVANMMERKSSNFITMYRPADNSRPVSFTVSAWEWVYATNLRGVGWFKCSNKAHTHIQLRLMVYFLTYYATNLSRLQRETRERNKQTARGRSSQCTNNSDPVNSMSELLLRQNSVATHDHQSKARRATENRRPKSTVWPIHQWLAVTHLLHSWRFSSVLS